MYNPPIIVIKQYITKTHQKFNDGVLTIKTFKYQEYQYHSLNKTLKIFNFYLFKSHLSIKLLEPFI